MDDHPINREILRIILEELYELREAATGEEAIEVAEEFSPDLILLDVMMPGIDGYETCRRLRRLESSKHSKIVMVSAKAMASDRVLGYDSGADDYVTKPFIEDELLAKVRVYMQLGRAVEVRKLKTDVLELLSHEFCTPLTHIKAPVELLLNGQASSPEDQKLMLEMIAAGADRIEVLVHKIVTLCSLLSGQLKLELERTSLVDLLRVSLDEMHRKHHGRKISVKADFPTEAIVMAAPFWLQYALNAVLDNAGRHSPVDSTVSVQLRAETDRFVVEITDQGGGIPREHIDYIFEPFACREIETHTEGIGLSLAITQLLIREHGGDIGIESPLGCGTMVRVVLPRIPSPGRYKSEIPRT